MVIEFFVMLMVVMMCALCKGGLCWRFYHLMIQLMGDGDDLITMETIIIMIWTPWRW